MRKNADEPESQRSFAPLCERKWCGLSESRCVRHTRFSLVIETIYSVRAHLTPVMFG